MKKILLGLAVIALSITVCTSCTKTCTCTSTVNQKVLDPSFFDYDQEDINRIETPVTTTATGKYKGQCSDQNSKVTQSNGIIEQTVVVECK
jgi:hypothetical protein